MSGLLKNYIKLLVESADDNEAKYADMIAAKNQEMQQRKFYGDELNRIIYELKNNRKYRPDSILKFDVEDVLAINGYYQIAEGHYRTVWSRNNVDFVIKVKKYSRKYQNDEFSYKDNVMDLDYNESNRFEHEIYFDELYHMEFEDPHERNMYKDEMSKKKEERYYNLSIYPKIYSYDDIEGEWIICEKVKTIDRNTSFKNIFPLFYQQIEDAYQIVKKGLNITAANDTFQNLTSFKFFNFFATFISSHYWYSYTNFRTKVSDSIRFGDDQTVSNYMKKKIIKFLTEECKPKNYIKTNFENDVTMILDQNNILFKITPDLAYVLNRLSNNPPIRDLHIGNMGYRDIKNPNKPWESFVILDYSL